jgi:hypothetical protein
MTDSELKVNDKRMFTADGELRDEFRHLEDPAGGGAAEQESPSEEPAPTVEIETPPPPASVDAEQPSHTGAPPADAPEEVGFLNLVGLLADHAAVYLGDTALADGKTMLDLRAAHAHIDLLEVVRRKTQGNLTEQESSFLADVLYRLRLVYVEKRRQEK